MIQYWVHKKLADIMLLSIMCFTEEGIASCIARNHTSLFFVHPLECVHFPVLDRSLRFLPELSGCERPQYPTNP